jgi:uncharacterized membrane protein
MFGFFFGTVCLVLLFAHLRRRHYYALYGPHGDDHGLGMGGCGPGYGGGFGRFGFGRGMWHGGQRRRGFRRMIARKLMVRLDTTPGQEKAIRAAVESVRNSLSSGRDEFSAVRRELAQAFGSDTLDEQSLTAALSRQEAFVTQARTEVVQALRNVHEALDSRQRRQVSEWIASGFSGRDSRDGRDSHDRDDEWI